MDQFVDFYGTRSASRDSSTTTTRSSIPTDSALMSKVMTNGNAASSSDQRAGLGQEEEPGSRSTSTGTGRSAASTSRSERCIVGTVRRLRESGVEFWACRTSTTRTWPTASAMSACRSTRSRSWNRGRSRRGGATSSRSSRDRSGTPTFFFESSSATARVASVSATSRRCRGDRARAAKRGNCSAPRPVAARPPQPLTSRSRESRHFHWRESDGGARSRAVLASWARVQAWLIGDGATTSGGRRPGAATQHAAAPLAAVYGTTSNWKLSTIGIASARKAS